MLSFKNVWLEVWVNVFDGVIIKVMYISMWTDASSIGVNKCVDGKTDIVLW